ncbi:hypothetical protein [Streptomyces atratus]
MTDDVRNIVLGVTAAGISAALGWIARTCLWRRKLRRKQAFFGLPAHVGGELADGESNKLTHLSRGGSASTCGFALYLTLPDI